MNKPVDFSAGRAYSPDPRVTLASAIVGVIATLVAIFTTDTAGRLLAAVAALVLFGYAGCDLIFRPRLTMDAVGVRVCSPLTRFELPWSEIDAVRADVRQRFGLRSTTLEVDGGSSLAVLSRRALGADPQAVALVAQQLAARE